MSTKRDEWLCGYATALANLRRLYDEPTKVREVLKGDGVTIEMLKDAGVEPVDLVLLRRCVEG